jgi:hypothetical protein
MTQALTSPCPYQVHFAGGSRAPISCKLASYREALAWVRDHWTAATGDLLTPVVIVCAGAVAEA